jgi:eukaryotic-like serine/threonine-protein kinase
VTEDVRPSAERPTALTVADRLDSWKEIAAYLKRDATTVRRWEKREGLPVHRHLHDRRDSVYAYSHEIDRWWEQRRNHLSGKAAADSLTATHPTRLTWVSVGAVLAVATIALAMFLAAKRNRDEGSRDPRVVHVSIQLPHPVVEFALSRDGRAVAFVTEANGTGGIWMRSLDSLAPRMLPGTEGADGSLFWSPDSRYVAFGAGGKLKKVAVSGGPVQVLCDARAVIGGTWSRDDVLVFAPATRTPLFRVSASGGEPVPVTTLDASLGHNTHRWPHFLPDGRRFLFLARGNKAEHNGIYAGSVESDRVTRIATIESQVAYSSPGYLLFARDKALLAQPFDANTLKILGEPVQVLDDVLYHASDSYAWFSVSDHGELAYQTSAAEPESALVWYDRHGGPIPLAKSIQDSEDPSLSPDGDRVAVTRSDGPSRDVWIVDRVKGSSRVTADASADIMPIWSPDGSSIVFASNREGPSDLYRIASSGSGSAEPLVRSASVKHPSDWSQSAGVIVYDINDPTTGIDIWTLPTRPGGVPQPFLRTRFTEGLGRLSPDGRWMAHVSNESGGNEIFVRPFPASTAKWKVSTTGGTEPRWRGDGRELFYLSNGRLMAVQVRTKPSFQASLPVALFDVQPSGASEWSYDVARDGQSFVFTIRIGDSAPAPIALVLNWTAAISSAQQ